MVDPLTLRRLDVPHECFATLYEHPTIGKIDVGRINTRSGNPHGTPDWHWSIGIVALPNAGRPAQGNVDTRKAAIAAWKAHWPLFRDAMTDADWHDAKAKQDYSAKVIMIYDARKLEGLTAADVERLRDEMGRKGPAPHWLTEMLARRAPSPDGRTG